MISSTMEFTNQDIPMEFSASESVNMGSSHTGTLESPVI